MRVGEDANGWAKGHDGDNGKVHGSEEHLQHRRYKENTQKKKKERGKGKGKGKGKGRGQMKMKMRSDSVCEIDIDIQCEVRFDI